jgi:hypothetical protein
MTERTQSGLVAEMIKLIRPDPGCEARCREKISESIIEIEKSHEKREVYLPAAEVKAQMKQLHGALKKVGRLVSKLNFLARTFLFYDGPRSYPEWFNYEDRVEFDYEWRGDGLNSAEFAREVGSLIKRTEEFARGLEPPKAAPRRSNARVLASQAAYRLIAEFAPFPPTLTKRGRFFRLANMLFEAAAREQKADLTRDCRETVSDYSLAAKELSKHSSGPLEDPALKAAAERLAQLASRKRRPTKRTDG